MNWRVTPQEAELLSRENSKAGRLQRAALTIIREHEDDGALPTSIRFVFYELEQRSIVSKTATGKRLPSQDVSDALLHLREVGIVPWEWIVDETRAAHDWAFAATVVGYLADRLEEARIDCWRGQPAPLILCESRSLAGVLRQLAWEHLCPLAATNGQAGGFLVTEVVPLLRDNSRPVLYLGDWDWSGGQIETATQRTLTKHAGRTLSWERVALTADQVAARPELPVIVKRDKRYTDGHPHEAVETEALKQTVIVGLVRDRLDELLPEPLEGVRVRERHERAAARVALHGRDGREGPS